MTPEDYKKSGNYIEHGAGARNNSNRSPIPPTEIRSSGARNSSGRPPRPPKN